MFNSKAECDVTFLFTLCSCAYSYAIGWVITFFLIKTGRVKPVLAVGAVFVVLCLTRLPEVVQGMRNAYSQGYEQVALVTSARDSDRISLLDVENLVAVEEALLRSKKVYPLRAVGLKRVKDSSAMHAVRKKAFSKANISLEVAACSSWHKCNDEVKRKWAKYRNYAVLLCMSSSYCVVRSLLFGFC